MPEPGSMANATLGEVTLARPKEPVQPAYVRVTHWINAIAMMAMIGSGWEIYNASPLFPFARPNELWVALCPEHRSFCDIIELSPVDDGCAGSASSHTTRTNSSFPMTHITPDVLSRVVRRHTPMEVSRAASDHATAALPTTSGDLVVHRSRLKETILAASMRSPHRWSEKPLLN